MSIIKAVAKISSRFFVDNRGKILYNKYKKDFLEVI